MDKIEAWLERIDCEGELELISSKENVKKVYRLKSSMHSGIVMDASCCKETVEPFIEIEHRLYEAGVKVAKIFTYNKKEGFVFMEDLGDTHLFDILNNDFELFYNQALDSIMKMQNVDIEDLPLYDEELLRSQMDLMVEFYLEKHLGITLDDEQKKNLETVFKIITTEVLAQPHGVFVHGDFHSKNIMFGCSDNIVLIDYQDAKVGALTYDLVSLLRDVAVEFDVNDVERLALAFKDKIGLDVDNETFMRWFDFTGLQRHLMLLGTSVNDRPLTLKYIYETASKYPETKGLIELLEL
ncbi:phosphotransferase [bacterium]|nr:phosphotransferase [bacterium]MBU1958773.1 phosphotransferase [bacterium]